ncbi:hypothetical protein J3Q64DRAFT_1487747 [Phycomyces blakesleeanus]|uniref:DNA replication complex GINS protein SLD5 n=2 Tax=Phycomyces blakesleeanus TaxID=4837 RepID=A0A162PZ20_PHYB8|nr:hypothetical protein PHYBLDRAFT_166854 [Phycomyces blakesleeanus NRRL 1555(-)]OAD75626.1 hypothetical protein PHYBLDRAFT_166854 [Phycomyces blakesleeanus NRRL 1555(-)]|eukprot:XP_018293666.1 hypothetical protein PHYBLDRAFT_166854 [Phycomyces blakesleeanus NRRL 1555(-)]
MSVIEDDTSTVNSSQNNLSFHLSQEDSLYAQAVAVSQLNENYDDDQVTALTHAWINERNSPELLKYKRRLVESLLDKLREKIDNVLDSTTVDAKNMFVSVVYETEVERVRYLIKSYLRARLFKIEKFALHLLRLPDYEDIMSPQEIVYARSYQELLDGSNHEAFVRLLPPSQHKQDEMSGELSMIVTPNLEAPVFCRFLKDGQRVVLSMTEMVDYEKGDIVLLRYRSVKDLLEEGTVELI